MERTIKLNRFTYLQDVESKDTLIIRYNFDNALWYEINGKRTTKERFAIYKPEKGESIVTITVKGFFTQKIYTVIVKNNKVYIPGVCIPAKNRSDKKLFSHTKIKA
ncbi:hypothetical protein GCM10007424_26230 [Flavobacterium suaedae]|uniref:Uncharacterized protein n=1 Tax=Flavobacterium suaedae TaxID=1767027 RepID=A0ABQ1K5M5_9FLAO|nr:hypothetical protein [Flavobacterium suaedae]GGB84926.1 hypothetical protein GCM10007424_26230 [Flavobacterium suaedae]